MIGEPTNFVHTTHVGSGDMGLGLASVGLVLLLNMSLHEPVNLFSLFFLLFAIYFCLLKGGPCSSSNEI